MLFTIAVTLNFSEQFHVINNTIFHTKYTIFLLSEILFKHVKFLASKTCDKGMQSFQNFLFLKIHKRCEIFISHRFL